MTGWAACHTGRGSSSSLASSVGAASAETLVRRSRCVQFFWTCPRQWVAFDTFKQQFPKLWNMALHTCLHPLRHVPSVRRHYQYLMLTLSHNWLGQLHLNSEAFGRAHLQYQKCFWSLLSERPLESQKTMQTASPLRRVFDEAYYNNLVGDSYLIPSGDGKTNVWDAKMLGKGTLCSPGTLARIWW